MTKYRKQIILDKNNGEQLTYVAANAKNLEALLKFNEMLSVDILTANSGNSLDSSLYYINFCGRAEDTSHNNRLPLTALVSELSDILEKLEG